LLLLFLRIVCGQIRGDVISSLIYSLNYEDGMKAKVRRMKEEVQRSGISGQISV